MRRLFSLLSIVAFTYCGNASAQSYKPDFSCNDMPPKNGVAVMLCQNSEAAKHELEFDQAYYALRHIVGKDGWKALRQEVILDENAMNQQCGLPIPGDDNQTIPQNGTSCYEIGIDRLTVKYKSRLSGNSLEETNRAIDQHIALQQKLIDLGYLPSGSVADGVYGDATRDAIETWQRVNHRPSTDGFLSDADAGVLMGASQASTNAQASAQQPPPDADSGVPSQTPSDPCGGNIIPVPPLSYYNGNLDPYGAKGKCFAVSTSQPDGNIQWLSANALLILGYPILIASSQHIELNRVVVGIAVDPVQYDSASGAINTPLTLRFLRYTD
ncbi:peptidoglycan-binding domain-containing protein [Acetobacter sp. UBA5411]|uniref:peptidoglycan-binding domain-containing protein n=1 Tax=Acetobacter sp. UBA5411 TaxID=1945905 RepID=UPI0025BF3102|nr:peptidoglycan-binding protein [Acetobacter sp. UBA5411]